MASEIKRDRVIGNFRPGLRDRLKPRVSAQQRREGNSKRHLELVRQMPCIITGKPPRNDPHHLLGGPAAAERSYGCRATDQWVVPICRVQHEIAQRLGATGEMRFFKQHGIEDVYEFCRAIWKATGDLDRMIRIELAHVSWGN